MQAGDHIQSSETAAQDSTPSTSERGAQDSTPSTSYRTTTSESTARWDAKKRAVKVPPLGHPPPRPRPYPCVFSLCRSWYVIRSNKTKGNQTGLL